jgi:arylsulfatase A-like enzyme
MNRREFLAGTALAVSPAARAAARPPNIIWIMADDLGIGNVGCYGQREIRTPNIDQLAREGMRFTEAYAGCTVCAPSRSVLMTGLHMGHTPIRSNPGGTPLLASEHTVAEMLQKAGYVCGGFGKWGLGEVGTDGVPSKHGFDEFFGYLHQVHAHHYYPEYLIDNEKKFPLPGNEDGKRTTYSHDVIAGRALDFIRKHRSRPFFCYVPLTIPHLELLVPEDSLAEYRGKVPEDKPYVTPRKHYADQPHPRAAYAGMVTRMDRDIGRMMALLKELKLDRDTLVFFTSDNGDAERLRGDDYFHGAGPYRGHKQNLYEGGIRAPMIARWTGRIKPGATSSLVWYFGDFYPTAAELAGQPAPKGLDGISIVPELLGRPGQKRHEFLYWELPAYQAATATFRKGLPMQAVRMGDWKAVRPKPDAPLELYNLKTDVGESKNVAAENPAVMARIEKYLATARVEPREQKEPPSEWTGPNARRP